MSTKNMRKTAIILMIVTIFSKFLGFFRESIMAKYYGASNIVAIYTVSTIIPVVISEAISNGVIYSFIPIYDKVEKEKGIEEAEKFTSNVFNILMIIGLFLGLISFIFAENLCKIFSPSLEGLLLKEATLFTRITIFSILPYFYSSIYRGYINLKGEFLVPSTPGIFFNFFLIIIIIISSKLNNPIIIPWGTLLANVFQYALFPKTLNHLGYQYTFSLDRDNKYVKDLLIISVPIIISAAASDIALIVDNSVSSYFFGNRSISILKYSRQLSTMTKSIITLSVTTSIFPLIAKLGQDKNFDKMKVYISKAITLTLLIVIPAIFGIMSLSNPMVRFVYGRGKFGESDIVATASMLFAYSSFVIFQSISDIIDKGFYSVGNSKTPVKVVLIQQIVNVILDIVLAQIMGIQGIAYATVISCLIGMILMAKRFKSHFGTIKNKHLIISIVKILVASLIMAKLSKKIFNLFTIRYSDAPSFLLTILLSAIIYGILVIIFKVPETKFIINKISKTIVKIKNIKIFK